MTVATTEIPRGQRLRMGYAGADYLERRGQKMSPLGITVAEALGFVWQGIYHLSHRQLAKTRWDDERGIEISVNADLATYDDDRLTRLVVLCHDLGLRMSVEPAGPRHLRLRFWQRTKREGRLRERMPTLDEHVAMIREGYDVAPPAEDA